MADSQSASSSRSFSPASDDIDAVASPSQRTGIEPINVDDVQLDSDINTGTPSRANPTSSSTANNASPTSSRRPAGSSSNAAAGSSAVQASRPSRQSDRRRVERYNGRQSQQTMDGYVVAGGAVGDERAERQTFDRLLDIDYSRDFGDPFARFDQAQEQQRLHRIQQAEAGRASQSASTQASQSSMPAAATSQGGDGQGTVQSGDVAMS